MIKRNSKGQFVKGNTIKLGFHFSDKSKLKMRLAKLGKKLSERHRLKIKESMQGKHALSENPNWKGDKVTYGGLHKWVRDHRGGPIKCEECRKEFTGRNTIHWANKSGEYKRDLKDWVRLCPSCHKKLDMRRANNNALPK